MNGGVKRFPIVVGLLGIAWALSGAFAKAAVITQWTFNGSTVTAASNANTPAPTTGSGYATQLGMTNPYNGGSQAAGDFPNTSGSAVPSFAEYLWRVRAATKLADGTANNLPDGTPSANGWALYNISSGTAHDGAPQYTQGIELDTSTVGYSNISFNFDWYCTTQGVRDLQFQYNLNVSNSAGWTNFGGTTQDGPGSPNSVYVATPNDFYGGANPEAISVNLNSIAGANNNANFGVRLVSAFDDTGRYQDYVSATLNGGITQLYNNSSGNWRFGNLTFQGALTLNTTPSGPALTWNSGGSGAWDTSSSNMVWLDSGSNSASYADGSRVTFGNVSSGTASITVASGGVVPTGIAINNMTPGTGYAFAGGAIGGSGALYLQPTNAGFVSLSGTNTYTGGTQVSGGTLIVAGDGSLGTSNGAGGAVVIDNGAALQLASSLSSGRLFEIGNNGGVLDTQTFAFSTSGSFLASGPFTKLGSGNLTLTGAAVQLSGSTTITAGDLVLAGSNAASLQGGGTFNGNLVVNGPKRVNFDSVGSTGLYGGSGQIQISYRGNVTANLATNAWAVLSNSPTGSVTAAGGEVTSGGTVSNNVVLNPNNLPFTKTNVAATFALPTSNAFIAGIGAATGGTLALLGNISGSSDLVLGSNSVNGAGGGGVLILSGSNSFAGTTLIDGNGVMQLGSSAALPPTTDVIFGGLDASTATLDLNGFSQTINTLSAKSGASTITNSNPAIPATLTISGGTTAKTGYNGSISGNLAIYKTGPGSLTLTGSSSYTGATVISQGTLTVGNSSALGVGPLYLNSGATLNSSGATVSLANSSAGVVSGALVSPGGAGAYGTVLFNNLGLSGGSLAYDFNTTQSDLIAGSGTLDLTGASPGSIVVNLNTSGQTFNSYPLLQFGSVSNFNSNAFAIGSGTMAGYTYGFLQNAANPGEIDLAITGTGSNDLPTRQSLSWAASSGAWSTAATNWGGGGTYVDGDSVTFGEPAADNSVVTISGTAVTPLSMTISNSSNSYTFTGGPITGTTALYKINSGMATLSTSNSYTGGTFITGGTLALGAAGNLCLGATSGGVTLDTEGTLMTTTSNFSSSRTFTVGPGGGTILTATGTSSVSGAFTIAPDATFNKTGTATLALGGAVTAGAGSTISVQAGTLSVVPENFTANGDLNISPGATFALLTKTATSAASASFLLGHETTVDGNLTVANPLTLSFNGIGTISGSGAIQFQNMQTPPAPTHFSIASAQSIQLAGNYLTQDLDVDIHLNSLNKPFYKTSISQSGSTTNGTGFILGNGTADAFFAIAPGVGNTLNINGVISGSCDVQFGGIGGGGGGNIYLNRQNTYTGVTMFEFGVLGNVTLGTSNALPPTTDLIFAPINGNSYQAKLDLNGNSQTVASLSYWAYANPDGTSLGMQVVNGNPNSVATLTVRGDATPSCAFGGVLGDTGNQNLILVKDGPNTLWLTGNNNSYTGGTVVNNGLLLLSPSNTGSTPTGWGDVTVNGGTLQGIATIGSGNPSVNLNVGAAGAVHPGTTGSLVTGGKPGMLAVLGSATFADGANVMYDFGTASNSLLTVSNALTLPATGSVTIGVSAVNYGALGFASSGAGGTVFPLMEFGNLTNSYNAGMLTLGAHPTNYTFSFSGTNASEIDLVANYLGAANLTWVGGNGNIWSATAKSFSGGMSDGSLTPSDPGDNVTFNDTAGTAARSITINGSVAPGIITFSNSAAAYSVAGGAITGTGSLVIEGHGLVLLGGTNSYSGGTTVLSGTLDIANAAALPDGGSLTVGAAGLLAFGLTAGGSAAAGNVAAGAATAVPEPSTLGLLAVGLLGLAGYMAGKRSAR
jgi:fibronectin-binding autotransporter adhesin